MTFYLIFVTCLLASFQTIYSNPASFIKKCTITDSKCIKASAQAAIPIVAAGIPEFGMETIDPLVIKSLDGSSPNLKLKLDDVTATGLGQCIAKKIEFNADQSKLLIKLLCTIDAKGHYVMDGKLSALPIKGDGKAHVILNKMLISATLDISEVQGAGGNAHWKISKWEHSYELKEQSVVELENLFEGNEVFSRAVKELLYSSPNEVVKELGPKILNAVVEKVVKVINKLFSKISKADLVE